MSDLHCWADYQEWLERTAGQPTEVSATCMLPDGHTGPHQWTNDSEIVIQFADKPKE